MTPEATFTPLPTQTVVPTEDTSGLHWWNQTVFYEIFVRSFRDSDGDGIGDFNGVIEKLEYLEDLGVKGLWLMPIHPSPDYHGYHVTDYYAVNPDYGSMEDFKRFLEEAHKRGIRVIIDLVINHTSAKHPWFQKALQNDPQYMDWYVWSDSNPGGVGPWGQTVWHPAINGKYYYAVYNGLIPDLNYNNPAVRQEVEKITAFWLKDVGVDGFRLDGARYYVEEGDMLADSTANHAFLQELGEHYRSINPEAFAVGEVWTSNTEVRKYVDSNLELDAAFNFDLANAILQAVHQGSNGAMRFVLANVVRDFPEQDNANFLTNHDMNRVMKQFYGNIAKAKTAASILFTAPGIPFIYYGEEIGMTGAKPDELIRTPMQWTTEEHAGFTAGTPWQPVNADYMDVNVDAETGDGTSLLEHYRWLIQLRSTHPALQYGDTYLAAAPSSSKLVSYLRVSATETLLVIINIDDLPVTNYDLNLTEGPLSGGYKAQSLLDNSAVKALTANGEGGFDGYTPLDEIPPYSLLIIQLTPQP